MKIWKRFIATCLATFLCFSVINVEALADGETSYSHGWSFSESDKTSPKGAKIGTEDSFTYEYGVNGKFSLMTKYKSDWGAWTLDGNAPAVGGWFLSGSEAGDGAIVWKAPRNMNVELSSEIKITLDDTNAQQCDGVGVMVIQQNDYGFSPLWPTKGKFDWHDVKKEGAINLSGLTTKVRKGDRILFVAHTLGSNSNGDTINIAPKVTQISSSASYPVGFYDWISDGKVTGSQGNGVEVIATYNHGWAYTESNKNNPKGAKIDGKEVFFYKYGINGKFSALNKYNKDWDAWTYNGNAPAVSGWYISATTGIDGAIEFVAPKNMHADISSEIKVVVDSYLKNKCDGVGIMILQQSEKGFAPLWPEKGSFKWYDVKNQGDTNISSVQTYLKKGEKVLFVVHSTGTPEGDNVNISPKISEISKGTTYPTKFIDWVEDPNVDIVEEEYISSWYIGEGGYKTNTKNNDYPFSYNYGFAGEYQNYLAVKESYDWGNVWRNKDEWAPWISGFFMSAAKGIDGVVTFTAPKTGDYKLSNNLDDVLKLDTSGGNESDGVQFLIVAQNASGKFSPLYPSKGNWEWQKIEKNEEYKFKPIEVSLKKGEKLLVIVHNSGTETNDTVAFDTKVALKKSDSQSNYPKKFEAWPEGFSDPDLWQNPTSLADLFSSESATRGPLSLKYGWDGDYDLMTYYREDWKAWTKGGNTPAIGADFMGSMAKNDAVIVYTAKKNGQMNLKSTTDICLDWPDESDGASLIVVLKNKNGERPIWPEDGKWNYAKVTGKDKLKMENISVFMEENDEIHIICRSTGSDHHDSFLISPLFDLDSSVTSGKILDAVERVYPTEDDYIKNLLDLDGKLDLPDLGNGILPIILIAVSGVGIASMAVLIVYLARKKRKGKGEQAV